MLLSLPSHTKFNHYAYQSIHVHLGPTKHKRVATKVGGIGLVADLSWKTSSHTNGYGAIPPGANVLDFNLQWRTHTHKQDV